MRLIEFYRTPEGKWYADLPDYLASGGTRDACEMVWGADTFLELVSHGEDKIKIRFNFQDTHDCTYQFVKQQAEDDSGACYLVNTTLLLKLCPVSVFVFANYPDRLYLEVIPDRR